MEVTEHIARLDVEGELMAKAAAVAGADAAIPTCPEWTMRDLVRHTSIVHRWATAHVAGARTERVQNIEGTIGEGPTDDELVDWFRDGHRTLVDALEAAPADLQCWSFLPAPSPLAFWARRQCHETGMHRYDAESAGDTRSAFPADVAADGIDELLRGFIVRPGGRLHAESPRTLGVHTTDTDDDWVVRIADTVETAREHSDADCVVSGPAASMHVFLWNRAGTDGLHVAGDATLLDLWRDGVTIRWR